MDVAYAQRVQLEDGLFGVNLEINIGEPLFLFCEEMLGLLTFLEQEKNWIEEHARYNDQWFGSETKSLLYAFLRQKKEPEIQIILSLHHQTDIAWYGTSVPPDRFFHGPPIKGYENQSEFPVDIWEEYKERKIYE